MPLTASLLNRSSDDMKDWSEQAVQRASMFLSSSVSEIWHVSCKDTRMVLPYLHTVDVVCMETTLCFWIFVDC